MLNFTERRGASRRFGLSCDQQLVVREAIMIGCSHARQSVGAEFSPRSGDRGYSKSGSLTEHSRLTTQMTVKSATLTVRVRLLKSSPNHSLTVAVLFHLAPKSETCVRRQSRAALA